MRVCCHVAFLRGGKNSMAEFPESVRVLYEDNHIIAVYKPAGVLVQGDATGDESLAEQVKKFLKTRDGKSGNVFLGIVHRLDRPVQGIVLFGKTSKGAARLSEQFRDHTVQKIYTAVVSGEPPKKGTLVHWILKDENKNRVEVFDRETRGALRAELSYEVVKARGARALVQIELKTGRPHQIRAQFSHIGHALLGDTKYGGEKKSELQLAATEIEFETATTHERKKISIAVPFDVGVI